MKDLFIRELNIADKTPFLLAMHRSQSFHLPWVNPPQTDEDFEKYIERAHSPHHKSFLLFNDSENILGVFNINEIIRGSFQSAYLGFYGIVNYARQGFMSKGLKLVLKNIFEEIGLHRIEANIQPENTRSISLIKANGFLKEGFSPRYLNINGIWQDHERWALTYEDWALKLKS